MSVIHDALRKGGALATSPEEGNGTITLTSRAAEISLGRRFQDSREPQKEKGAVRLVLMIAGTAVLTLFCFLMIQSLTNGKEGIPAAGILQPAVPDAAASRDHQDLRRGVRSGFTLSGIIHGKEFQALINDQVVSVGDRVQGAIVKRIEDKQVVLEQQGREVLLSL